MLGLRFCVRAFSSCGKRGPLFITVRGPLSWPLLLQSTGSRRAGSVVVAHGPSCSAACGIFPDQGSNPCPLHWQADSQPLRHQGSPKSSYSCRSLWEPHLFDPILQSKQAPSKERAAHNLARASHGLEKRQQVTAGPLER